MMTGTQQELLRAELRTQGDVGLRQELASCDDGAACETCAFIRGLLDGRETLRRVPVLPPFGSRWPR